MILPNHTHCQGCGKMLKPKMVLCNVCELKLRIEGETIQEPFYESIVEKEIGIK